MFEAFAAMRRVHELLQLLETAGRLELTAAQEAARNQLLGALDPAEGWSHAKLRAFCEGTLPAQVRSFIESLKDKYLGPAKTARMLLRDPRPQAAKQR
ncbi:MAG: hypothetical protein WAW96_15825 [Alphaproteobacteria bacterium]